MITYVAYDDIGAVQGLGVVNQEAEIITAPYSYLVVPNDTMLDCLSYVKNGVLKYMPAQPSVYHKWDYVNELWVPDFDALKTAKLSELETIRINLNLLPIQFANTLFDADATAQANVNSWQTQIANGASVPEGFQWRDYYNVMHPADNTFVNSLGVQMTLRGTLLYHNKWLHVSAINAITDFNTLLEYNCNAILIPELEYLNNI